ncbi:ceramide synthase 5-like [Hyalella azteca]|uniref:Ceramide synthase 5-like n=1 Tax=Hyalella azteca TaxID=294128 RepID=A0A8B7PG01_HYAAZ|nr:ceramide synthase 5-like [Hyalella azteca]
MRNQTFGEWFFLPNNITWNELRETVGESYPEFGVYWQWSIFFGAVLYIFRDYILIPFILKPLGLRAGVRSRPYPAPPPNKTLEDLYAVNRARPPRQLLTAAASRINWSERAVERWLRQKALSGQMTTLEKFCDMGWQATFYGCFFIAGLFIMLPQEFVWEPSKALTNFPFEQTQAVIWWYCVIDTGFYITQSYVLFTLDRRHDFYIMLSHHIITLSLACLNLTMNNLKQQALAVFLHEVADIPLSVGKMLRYVGRNADILGYVFALIWIATRLVAFPLMILVPSFTETSGKSWPAKFLTQGSTSILLILHILWTFEIVNAYSRKLNNNMDLSDGRSSPEELSGDSENEKMNHGGKISNGIIKNGTSGSGYFSNGITQRTVWKDISVDKARLRN